MDREIIDELLEEFLLEASERIESVEQRMLELAGGSSSSPPTEVLDEVRRQLHTLKGNAGMMGLAELQEESHRLEDEVAALDLEAPRVEPILEGLDRCRRLLEPLFESPSPAEPSPIEPVGPVEPRRRREANVRVPGRRLERLTELTTELAMTRARLAERLAAVSDPGPRWNRVRDAWRQQSRLVDALRREVLALRLVPLDGVFRSLRRLAHDEAARCGKRVRCELRGERTPLDRSLVEAAGEALGHLVRNAVVHGLETPEARRQAGKPEQGTLLVQASITSGRVLIEVIDDGAGVDRERLREAARRAGRRVTSEDDLAALLFASGLSTRASVDLAAGRGLGLAAVRDTAARVGGDVEVSSVEGVGTRFGLALPVSVATREVLLVEAAGARYALPVAPVIETVRAADLDPQAPRWRGRPLRRVDLAELLGAPEPADRERFLVVLEVEGRLGALVVAAVSELREVVVQELPAPAAREPFAGAAVLADGSPILVLDPQLLVTGVESAEREV